MPEMPEVETVVRSLQRHLPGRRIARVEIRDEKLAALDAAALRGRTVAAVQRSGKEIVIDLSTPRRPLWLCVHLRMTGKLIFARHRPELTDDHRRLTLTLDRGFLHFYDIRRFGRVRLATSPEQFAPPGLDILDDDFTPVRLAALIGGSTTAIKTWLLRQDRLVGFGNIYASEVCFAAGIDPRRAAGDLDAAQIKRVHRVTRQIFTKAIECGGTTIMDFMDCEGRCGDYRRFLKVYGREGERCLRRGCDGTVVRIVQAGRSTFFCPKCQA